MSSYIALFNVSNKKKLQVRAWFAEVKLYKNNKELKNPHDVTDEMGVEALMYTQTGILQWNILRSLIKDDSNLLSYFESRYDKVSTYTLTKNIPRITTSGKNLGKKNATTIYQQAVKDMNTDADKKKKAGFKPIIWIPSDELKIQEYFPQLLYTYADYKKKIVFPAYVQPKLNGERCIAFIKDGEVIMYHRNKLSNHFTGLYPIKNEISKLLSTEESKTIYLDGEIYLHGVKHFGTLSSLIDKLTKDTYKDSNEFNNKDEYVEFHVFDMFDISNRTLPFSERLDILTDLFDAVSDLRYIKLVECREITDEKELSTFHTESLKNKYEGTIIRNADGVYKIGINRAERSMDVLKWRNRNDDEFKIVDYETGKGKYSKVILWIMESKNGKRFSAIKKGTIVEKKADYDIIMSDSDAFSKNFKDKLMTVEYDTISDEGIPIQPVAIKINK